MKKIKKDFQKFKNFLKTFYLKFNFLKLRGNILSVELYDFARTYFQKDYNITPVFSIV